MFVKILTSQDNVIVLISYSKRFDIRNSNDDIRVTAKFFNFSIDITKGPAHGEPSRKHPLRSYNNLFLSIGILGIIAALR
jgi:hypothetical protein